MTWFEFLTYLTSTGIGVVVGLLLSVAVEYWPKYTELGAKIKRLVFGAFCLVVPFGGYALGLLTNEFAFISFQESIWPLLVAAFAAFSAGTVAHMRKM